MVIRITGVKARAPATVVWVVLWLGVFAWTEAHAHSTYKTAFMAEYPTAVGSRLDTLPSRANHCGLCHYSFAGAGTRNAYGNRFAAAKLGFANNQTGYRDALRSIENEDTDGDGFSNVNEIENLIQFTNTPTFPGLNSTTVASILAVSSAEVTPYVTPIAPTCNTCRGDSDGNGVRDARDVQNFVRCLAQGPSPTAACVCSDIDGNGAFNQTDVDLFVAGLLAPAPPCP